MATKTSTLGIEVDAATTNALREIARLEAQLEQIQGMVPEVEINGDASGALRAVDEVQAAVDAIPDRKVLQLIADTAKVNADIDRVTLKLDDLGKKTTSPKVDVDTAVAEAQLLGLQVRLAELESKKVNIKVDVDSSGAVTNMTLVDDAVKGATESMGGLQKAGVAVAAAFPLIATVVAALPAAVALIGVPLAAVVVGMDGLKTAVQSLQPEFAAVQAAVSAAFVQGLQPALAAAAALMPVLTTGLSGTATALSQVATAALSFVSSGPGLQQLQGLFDGINSIIASLAPSIQALTENLLTLANQGVAGLSGLGQVMTGIGDAWTQAIAEMSQTGAVQTAVAALVDIFGALMRIIPPLVEVGVEFFAAYGPQAAALLNALADVLQLAATGFNALFTALGSIRSGIEGLPGPLQAVVTGILNAVPGLNLITTGLGQAGTAAGTTATQLSPLQAAIDNVSKSQAAYNTAVSLYGPASDQAKTAMAALQTSVSALGPAQQTVVQAQTALNQAVSQFGPSSSQAAAASEALTQAQKSMGDGQKAAETAMKALTQAAKDQLSTFQGLVSATLGYQGSLLGVEAAQKTANQAIKDHGKNSLEARTAVNQLSQAIDGAAQAAAKQAESLTQGLSPLQQTQAKSNAYIQTLGNLAAAATGPTKTALLGLLGNYDATALGAASAAAEASGLKTEVLKLPDGKTMTIVANAQQIPQAMADAVKRAGETVLAPKVQPDGTPVPPALTTAQQQALGSPLGQLLVPDPKGVAPALGAAQQQATAQPLTMPIAGTTAPLDAVIGQLRVTTQAAPLILPLSVDTTAAQLNLQAFSAALAPLVAQVGTLSQQLGPTAAAFTLMQGSLPIVAAQVQLLSVSLPIVSAQFALLQVSAPIVAAQLTLMQASLPIVAAQLQLMSVSLPIIAQNFQLLSTTLPIIAPQLTIMSTTLPLIAQQFALMQTSLPIVAQQFQLLSTSLPLVAQAFTNLNVQFTTFGTQLTVVSQQVTTFVTTVGTQFDQMLAKIQQDMTAATQSITDGGAAWNTAITDAVNAIYNSVFDGFQNVANTVQDWMNAIADYLEQYYAVFDAIGQNFGISLANGMLAQQQTVFAAGQALGQAAQQGVQSALAQNSPSKVALDLGNGFGTSFASGLDSAQSAVFASAQQLGLMAKAGADVSLGALNVPGAGSSSGTFTGVTGSTAGAGQQQGGDTQVFVQFPSGEVREMIDKRIVRNNKDRRRAAAAQRSR